MLTAVSTTTHRYRTATPLRTAGGCGSHPNYSGVIADWLGLVRVSDYVLRRRALCRYMWASASRRS